MNSDIWLILIVAGIPAWWLLLRLGVRWRLAALAIPGGLLVGGLLSGMLAFLPGWAELALLVWLAGGMYGMLLVIGHLNKPWAEEQGWHW